jgi:hypothetical protein
LPEDPEVTLALVQDINMRMVGAMIVTYAMMAYTLHEALRHQIRLREAHVMVNEGEMISVFDKLYDLHRQYFVIVMKSRCPDLNVPDTFDLSRYLAIRLDAIIVALTQFSTVTWFIVFLFELICFADSLLLERNWQSECVFLILPPVLSYCFYYWARSSDRSVMETAYAVVNGEEDPPSKEESAAGADIFKDDRLPMWILQSVSFFSALTAVRILGSRRLYNGSWPLETWEFTIVWTVAILSILVQVLIQRGCFILCTMVLSMPPYLDDDELDQAQAVVHHVDGLDNEKM